MSAVSGFLSFIACSRIAVQFSLSSAAHGFRRRVSPRSLRLSRPSFDAPRMQSGLPRLAVSSDEDAAVEDVNQLEQGTKSGYTILVDYGKCEKLTESTDGEIKLFEALQKIDPERFPTSSSAKKTIRKGTVLVDGRPGRVDTKVTFGVEHLKIQHRTSTTFKPVGQAPFHVDILYEDHCVAVVHKPPGVTTHPMPEPGEKDPPAAMAQALTWFVSTAPDGTPGALWKPMVVHRLDKPTEGLLLVAKTKQAWQSLQQQFTSRTVSKRYLAVVLCRPDTAQGTVDLAVDCKKAVTDWRVLSCLPACKMPAHPAVEAEEASAPSTSSSSAEGFVTTLELVPHHGRTHQLRLHCSQGLGAPIVGDNRYGSWVPPDSHGLLLAAVGLRFAHPETGEEVRVNMDEPARFKSFREEFGDTSSLLMSTDPSRSPGDGGAPAASISAGGKDV